MKPDPLPSTARLFRRVVVLALLLLVSSPVALALPPLDVIYLDADAAAQPVARIDGEDAGQRSALEAQLRREPRNVLLRLQQAQVFADRGMRQRVARELAAAERAAEAGSGLARMVHYQAGWIHFRLGEFEAATGHWEQARLQHGGAPSWVPLTYALLLWSQGDRASALAYFDRAASDRPELLGRDVELDWDAAALSILRPGERFAIESMHEAWVRGDS